MPFSAGLLSPNCDSLKARLRSRHLRRSRVNHPNHHHVTLPANGMDLSRWETRF